MIELKNWRLILILGVVLFLLGLYVLTFDRFIGMLAIGFGLWNVIKGLRLRAGRQPYIIRKYQEQRKKDTK